MSSLLVPIGLNNDGHPYLRRPTFIDENGNICAVGYLVAQSLGRKAAKALNKKYKYAYIPEIDSPIFLEWTQQSGFTMTELAMIRSAYHLLTPAAAPPKQASGSTLQLTHLQTVSGNTAPGIKLQLHF